jgi:hypothetical protein
MSTRVLMSSSAAVLAALGVAITFLPQELLAHVGVQPRGSPVLLIQVLGALFMGMAALNWMNRGNRIGGIFGRPVSMANFVNFAVGAVALVKGAISQQFEPEVVAMAAIYAIFAAWFGWVLFTHPQGGTT